jgi:hypothetical protein
MGTWRLCWRVSPTQRSFVPRPAHQCQLAWRLDGVEQYLSGR